MDYMKNYNNWMENVKDKNLLNELKSLNEEQIKEAFLKEISFGTAGLRGILAPGPANMNIITVAKVTIGLANYLKNENNNEDKDILVAISSDPRNMSKEFVNLIISILAKNNIKTITYDDIKPTPMLSYLVRKFNCNAGIMITASHNPKEYNGYKVYNKEGAQLNLEQSDLVTKEINKVDYPFNTTLEDIQSLIDSKICTIIDESFDTTYLNDISSVIKTNEDKNIKIVFSSEHGTTYKILPKAFKFFGFKNIIEVKEQNYPDPNFSNTKSANPEEKEAYELSIDYANDNNGDIIIVNDPDGDRLGVVFKDKKNTYQYLSGNQTGALMIDYLIKRDLLKDGIIYQTIVTSNLGSNIAKANNIKVKETLTGFKFIGEQIELNKSDKLIFAYEESYGYLINACVRDKDAIQSSLLIAEMANYYLEKNQTLDLVLEELYNNYGYFYDVTKSISLSGIEGMKKINNIMNFYKNNNIKSFDNFEVENKIDYNESQNGLPKANVIKFLLKDLGWVVFRPSGTEPKLKIYICIKSTSINESKNITDKVYKEIEKQIEGL